VQEPAVLIIIVTYNKKEYISNLLDSIRDIDYKNHDIVVIDNASTDGTESHLKENFPDITLIRNRENTGGSGGFNTGLSYAFEKEKYKYYWLLDNDVVVSKDALSALVSVLDKNSDIAVAGSQMCQLDNPEVTNEIGAFVDLRRGNLILNRHLTRKRNNSTGIFDVDYIAAASLLVRANVAKKAGLWEDFFIHFDDVDWCLKIKKMGYRVVGVADSVIWHLSAEEKPITWQQYYDVRNMLFLLNTHASRSDVARFGRRKCLQAVHTELKGLTPIAEIILDAIEDFQNGIKGGKVFNFPENINEETLKHTHPDKDVIVFQNEWFDLKKFPFEDPYKNSIKEIMISPYFMDARYYWATNSGISVKWKGQYRKRLLMLFALLTGYRKYKRSYIDIRYMPYSTAFLSDEQAVNIGESHWLIKRDNITVWRNLFQVTSRSMKNYVKFLFLKDARDAV